MERRMAKSCSCWPAGRRDRARSRESPVRSWGHYNLSSPLYTGSCRARTWSGGVHVSARANCAGRVPRRGQASHKKREQAAEVVGPKLRVQRRRERLPGLPDLVASQETGAAAEQDPGRVVDAVIVAGPAVEGHGFLVQPRGRSLDDGLQVEITVGNVHGQHAAGLELAEVELESLQGEQVHGNRIAGKRVHDQN